MNEVTILCAHPLILIRHLGANNAVYIKVGEGAGSMDDIGRGGNPYSGLRRVAPSLRL